MRGVLGIALMSVMVGVAYAQSGNTSGRATQLAREARDLAGQKRWSEACPRFEASLHLDPTIDRRFELAGCYERIGKFASAWRQYHEGIDLAEKANDFVRHNCATTNAKRLEAQLSKLTVSPPAQPPVGFIIDRDGERIDPGALGVAIYVDPGKYEITASAPGFRPFKQVIVLSRGEAKTLTIPNLEALVEPFEPSRTRRHIALGTSAVGGTALGVGLLLGLHAISLHNDAKKLCGGSLDCSTDHSGEGNRLVHAANASATASTALIMGGGAVVLTSVVVLLATSRPKKGNVARIAPWLHDGVAGLVIEGRF